MALVANRRSVMTLFSDAVCPYSHRTRIVLAEKNITVEVVNIDPDNKPEDLIDLNPYQTVPTLVDRELVLYGSRVIMEYLDERFPHPPLMPVDPVSRAQLRLVHHRILRDWYSLARVIDLSSGKKAEQAAKQLKEGIVAANELFRMSAFVLSDELTLVDCTLGPLLWRLTHYGVKLGKPGASVEAYAHRIFSRFSFKASLTQAERDLVLAA